MIELYRIVMKCTCFRALCLLLIPTLLLSFSASAAVAESPVDRFTDLKHDWSYEPITWCVENGLMNGMSETRFAPKGTVTRAQFITVLCRIAEQFGYNMNGYVCADRLTDIKSSDWYAKSVTWGYKNGIVKGISAHFFAPNATLTRQDMATLLCRFLENYLLYDLDPYGAERFDDYKKIASYAKDAVMKLASAGLLRGSAGCFDPKNTTTRAEMAAVLQRLFSYVEAQGIEPFARLKYGINLYTYEGACNLQNVKTNLQNLWNGGMDHVRLQLNPTLTSDYDRAVADNYTKDENGYHLNVRTAAIERAKEICRIASDLGMTVILDNHDYCCYPNLVLHHEAFLAEQRAYLEKQLERQAGSSAEADVRHDLTLLDQICEAFEKDPESAAAAVMDGRKSSAKAPIHYRNFTYSAGSSVPALTERFEAFVTAPAADRELWAEMWETVAREFSGFGSNVFFELINETRLTNEDVIAATRAVRGVGDENSRSRMIVVYTYCWEYYSPSTAKPKKAGSAEEWDFGEFRDDPNIMFDVHHYSPVLYTNGSRQSLWPSEELATEKPSLATLRTKYLNEIRCRSNAANDLAGRTGRRVWIGETGCNKLPQGRADYYEDFNAIAVDAGLPICFWCAASNAPDSSLTFYYTGRNYQRWDETTRYMIFN